MELRLQGFDAIKVFPLHHPAVAREIGVAGLAELLNQYTSKPESLAITYGIRFEEELENSLIDSLASKLLCQLRKLWRPPLS